MAISLTSSGYFLHRMLRTVGLDYADVTVVPLNIAGAEDALTPPADGAALAAAIPGAKLAIVPRAGHLSPLENPRAFNAAVRAFLRSL